MIESASGITKESVDQWRWTCPQCGDTFLLHKLEIALKHREEGLCDRCAMKRAHKEARGRWYRDHKWIFGAKILRVNVDLWGDDLRSILIEGTDGERRVLKAAGYDERYIEIEEISETRARSRRWCW